MQFSISTDEMYNTVINMKCFNKKGELQNALQTFQKGILMSITSMKLLRSKMEEKFGLRFLLTHRLNQDCLENIFCQVRGKSGANDHPSPVECLQRIKAIMLGKNPGVALHSHSNTIEQDPEEYVSAKFMNILSEQNHSTENEKLEKSAENSFSKSVVENEMDWSMEFLDEAFTEYGLLQHNFRSDDSEGCRVEYIDDTLIENGPAADNMNASAVMEYELRQKTISLQIELVDESCPESNNIHSQSQYYSGSNEVTEEFIKDLDTQMPTDALTKRIENTKEDGIGKQL